MSPPIDKIEI